MKKLLTLLLSGVALFSLVFCNLDFAKVANAETESAINVYSTSSGLIAPAPVIMEYNGDEDLSEFTKTVSSKMVRPSTMIVEVDENFTVLSNEARVAFDEFRLEYIKGKMLPAVRVESEGAANALISYLSTKGYDFIDFAVVSTSPALVKKVREDRVSIRGIIDYSKTDLSKLSAGQIANQMNANKSIIGIFDYSQLDAKKVFDLQARFKSVWLKKEISNSYDVYEFIASGASGIITDNYATVYDTYTSIDDPMLSRGFYGIGHRGLPSVAGENTLEGMIAAYEAGATHVEVDAKVCKSGEIVIMHDDGLTTTTNGTGNVMQMTLDEIRQYKVVKNSDGKSVTPCEIPTLEDVFKYFKGKDIVLIVETKNAQSNYPGLLAELIEKYDIADQVVVIGFGLTELGLVRDEAPEIPTANLNGTTKNDFLIYMAQVNALNTVPNPSKSSFMTDTWLFKNSIARGYLPYCWTFTTGTEAEGGVARGVVGITTDCVDSLGKYVRSVEEKEITLTQTQFEGSFNIKTKTNKGDEVEKTAKVLSYKEISENVYTAIVSYEDNGYNRLTQPITVTVIEDSAGGNESSGGNNESGATPVESASNGGSSTSDKSTGKGCKGSFGGVGVGIAFILLSSLSIRRKVKKR